MSEMTLEQVRDSLREVAAIEATTGADSGNLYMEMADAIDAHLAQPAQAVDVVVMRTRRNGKAWQYYEPDYLSPEAISRLAGYGWEFERLTRALSGEKAGPVGDGWMPIETSPQDGTRVLLWVDQTCRVGSWKCFPADAQNPCAPTHWMPLPASPTPDKEGM
jgi:hypothetical protein